MAELNQLKIILNQEEVYVIACHIGVTTRINSETLKQIV